MASLKTTLQDDLEWLAFQYAAGELQGAEVDAFELRLASDLAACEALAAAVMLCHAVAVCEQEIPVSSKTDAFDAGGSRVNRPGRQLVSWSVLALLSSAACLVLMVKWIDVGPSPRGSLVAERTSGLVELWIDGAEQSSGASDVELGSSTRESGLLPEDESGAVVVVENSNDADPLKSMELESDEDDAVPGWMLAAIAERQLDMGATEAEIMQD
jgi:hypothetical protein